MQADTMAPLILTLEFEAPYQDWAQALRTQYFPPERNIVPAHVTLFHALPPDVSQAIQLRLRQRMDAPGVRIDAPYSLGRGVAFRIHSAGLSTLRASIVSLVGRDVLTRQDAAAWRPHLTVQNKVEPDRARRLLRDLTEGFEPIVTNAAALNLWRYEGGPWTLIERFPFGGEGERSECSAA
ncbi:hypothetical protein AA0535_2631 [Asaia krungthepensis NRIC 0535]|uniref:2'-5' RNA ligase family protein n=2 Tax=Asaia krungthepensis TaxID=220990 RepID=A0ABQ0Q5S6_9PROT|nr:hypothetical protein AA0535_2631 [Asaia krungthepensis NRIC 0535]